MENNTSILVNVQTNDYYRHLSGDTYKNLRTGVSGEINPEIASKVFVLSVDGSFIMNKYPMVERFIAIGLKKSIP